MQGDACALGEARKAAAGADAAVAKAFEIISTATVSRSAAEAQEHGYIADADGITMNRYRLLADAKRRALELAKDYKPPAPPTYVLPGPTAKAALKMAVDGFHKLGKATDYDLVVSDALANVLSGDTADITETITEDDVLRLEWQNFMHLVRQRGTADRITHMLETGKPLRN